MAMNREEEEEEWLKGEDKHSRGRHDAVGGDVIL